MKYKDVTITILTQQKIINNENPFSLNYIL
jgi:hypothetical protein